MAQTVVILNPGAGKAENGEAIIRQWVADRPDVALLESHDGDITQLARQAVQQGARVVVAVGGDGTASDVVNGIMDGPHNARLAIIPTGTGNDFVRTVGIPADLEQALAIIDRGHTRRIDLIRVTNGSNQNRYLLNAATGGFSDVVHRNLTPRHKRWLGPLAYVWAAIKSLRQLTRHRVRVTVDDRDMCARTYAVIVSNGEYVAGGQHLTPDACVDDGLLDLAMVTAEGFWQRFVLLLRYWSGRHLRDRTLLFQQARRVRIDAQPTMKFISDGDPIGPTPLVFEVMPRALELVAPPEVEPPGEANL